MIIATSINGIFTIDTSTNIMSYVLKGNFFGITQYNKDCIIVAENILDPNNSIAKIRFLDFNFKDICNSYVINAKDIHQIIVIEDKLFITDTSNDKIKCIFLKDDFKEYTIVNLQNGAHSDRHHLNALCEKNGFIYIGLNKNIANKNSSIAKIKLNEINYDIPIRKLYYEKLNNVIHSHDLEPYKDDFLISASNQGYIYSYNKKEPLFNTSTSWARGIAISKMGLWVGYSAVAVDKERRKKGIECSVNLFKHDTFELIGVIKIKKIGQICDLIHIPKNEMVDA